MRLNRLAATILVLSAVGARAAGAAPPAVSPPSPPAAPLDRAALAAQVRTEFLHAWQGYERYAWGHDELKPLSRTFKDWHRESLLMTPVDALDTLLLMGLTDEAAKAKALIVAKLSFDKDISVKVFEIAIRILGGLLSSYQMTGDPRLLELADELGTRLLPAFNSPTGLPYQYVNLKTGRTDGPLSNPAESGTLLLEFGTLARLTHKPVFYEMAKNALVQLYDRRFQLSPYGLVGEEIDVETGEWTSPLSHVSGGIDSYYEYLLKGSRLFGDADCGRMWRESLKTLDGCLADEAPTGLWYRQVDRTTGWRVSTEYGALDAFFPAVLALGGELERARRLQASGYKMWQLHGIEPEVIDYHTMKVEEGGYRLRPEIIESAFYLYRITKDPQYLEMGQTFFAAIVAHCRTDAGYTVLEDVVTKRQGDLMPSYFLAETLKYLYLLFAPDGTLDLGKVVFNTEAHPLRRIVPDPQRLDPQP